MWLPFFLMRRLHFGQVPIAVSSTKVFRGMPRVGALYTSAAPGPALDEPRDPLAREGTVRSVKEDCVFCRIVARRTPADVEYEDDAILVFKDIYPKAPVHLLIVPKRHIESLARLEPTDADVLGRCVAVARLLGERTGYAERGYRLACNTGPEGGQVVYHVHFHFTAGRR
jgi:histidine triad (HIT) family protein